MLGPFFSQGGLAGLLGPHDVDDLLGAGKLPTWVVRMRVELFFIATSEIYELYG